MLADQIILRFLPMNHHLSSHRGVMQMYQWVSFGCDHSADHGLSDTGRHVKAVDPDKIPLLYLGGVADELTGELVDAGVVHGSL